ncbi:MAG TPA: hypothetical protein VGS41_11165, partial [Chthonomonadales bacterium]|nr:hypothetical protein [Chthonomonadales bacterium]
ETDVALMMLPHLAGQRPEWRDEPIARQYLWLLAIVKMVEEGRKSGEDDTMWNPQDTYKQVLQGLALRYDTTTEDEIKTIIAEIQATLEVMDRNGDMDKGKLLALLRSYTITEPALQALSDFLTQEIEAEAQIQIRRRDR